MVKALIVSSKQKEESAELSEDYFLALVRFISHPLASPTAKIMRNNFEVVKTALDLEDGKFAQYF